MDGRARGSPANQFRRDTEEDPHELTKEQQDKIREATGQDAEVIELNAGELEDRISPWGPRMTM